MKQSEKARIVYEKTDRSFFGYQCNKHKSWKIVLLTELSLELIIYRIQQLHLQILWLACS